MSLRLRLNSWLLPLLTLAFAALQIFNPSPVWKAFLVALGGVLAVGTWWAWSLKENLRLERAMRYGWAQVGDKLEERFTLVNEGKAPATWVEVLDHSTLPGYSATLATVVGGNNLNNWQTAGICSRRGVYLLGGTSLRTGDPFGLYTIEIDYPKTATLMVTPPVMPLPSIEVTPGGYLGEGRPRPNEPEQTVSAASVREYAPGDSLHLVHWPTTARHGKLFVRDLEGAPAGDWWVALDFDSSVQAGEGWESTTELGVILAASLVDRGLRARRSVGMLASGKQPLWMRPSGGEQRRWEVLHALATLEPGAPSLAELLERAGPALGRHASLIVITPSTQSEWLDQIAHLYWRGIIPTVILMDPATFGAPQNAESTANTLTQMNVPHHVVTRELLDRPEAHPGQQGQWEWHVTATGRAIAERKPANLSWRRLS